MTNYIAFHKDRHELGKSYAQLLKEDIAKGNTPADYGQPEYYTYKSVKISKWNKL